MTMHGITSVGRPLASMPAFWRDYESLPFVGFGREMEGLFDKLFRKPFDYPHFAAKGLAANWPMVEFNDLDSKVVVTAEVPGLTAKDVDLFFDNGMLTIRGEKKGRKDEFGYSEFFYGRFERQIPLPYSVDVEHCTAEFRDGLLTVELPKLAEVENKKKIPIKVETRH